MRFKWDSSGIPLDTLDGCAHKEFGSYMASFPAIFRGHHDSFEQSVGGATLGKSVMGMATAGATGGSEWEGWGKEIVAIRESGLQDTGFYLGSVARAKFVRDSVFDLIDWA
jgi:hypothetical protein